MSTFDVLSEIQFVFLDFLYLEFLASRRHTLATPVKSASHKSDISASYPGFLCLCPHQEWTDRGNSSGFSAGPV
jgi:hypothetical protein